MDVEGRWIEGWNPQQRGCRIILLLTFKHHQKPIILVCSDNLISIQPSLNKCRYHSVPVYYTLTLREVKSVEKSILPALPSLPNTISSLLAVPGKAIECRTFCIRMLTAAHSLPHFWYDAKSSQNMLLINISSFCKFMSLT